MEEYTNRIVRERFMATPVPACAQLDDEVITVVPITLAHLLNEDLNCTREKLAEAEQTINTFRALTESLTKLVTDLRSERDAARRALDEHYEANRDQ